MSKLIRNRGATQPPAHFHRNPLGRGQLAVFPSRGRGTRSSRIDLDMRPPRALPAAHFERNDATIICERVHWFIHFVAGEQHDATFKITPAPAHSASTRDFWSAGNCPPASFSTCRD